MNRYCIAYFFLCSYAINLSADDNRMVGAALFAGSTLALGMLHKHHKPQLQDPATSMVQAHDTSNIKKLQNAAIAASPQRTFIPKTTRADSPSPTTIAHIPKSPSQYSLEQPTNARHENASRIIKFAFQSQEVFPAADYNEQEFHLPSASAAHHEIAPMIHEQSMPQQLVQTFFPNFSDPIFTKLHNQSSYKDPAQPSQDFLNTTTTFTEHRSSSDSPIFKHQTITPNPGHAYWVEHGGIIDERISLYVVHGSFNESLHGSRENMMAQYESNLAKFGQKISLAQQKPVDIKYFKWNGAVDKSLRTASGQTLADIIAADPNAEIITLSHSHGGTVVAHAAEKLKGIKIIDRAILFGCPDFGQEINIHDNNIVQIFNIYSHGDFTGRAGSFLQTANLASLLPGSKQTTLTTLDKKARNIVNIAFQLQGEHLTHKDTVAYGIPHADQLIQHCMGRNMVTNIHDAGPTQGPHTYDIQACLDPKKYHPGARPEQRDASNRTAEHFAMIYRRPITDKRSLAENYRKEIAQEQSTLLHRLGQSATAVAACLEYDPVETTISEQINMIHQTPDRAEQLRLLSELPTKLPGLLQAIHPTTIDITVAEHLAYHQLRESLDKDSAV